MDMEKVFAAMTVFFTVLPFIRAVLEPVTNKLEEHAKTTEAVWDNNIVSKLRILIAILDGILLVLPKISFGKRSK